ncbi:hypothetical protein TEA_018415 [Camellia sinensis var. sinensis]|uniref:F-box/LRR-repeat protein 15/At3g58940/PEG3-like LRR domain-containing protein n=1 Tax=Camellia sinensis var. sinensis TaxID=542762 RepID=A0A4S4CW62_CAMSN|nr:hypothetical protein TEA_018415 [Camellia sinensis var. sinensis]
MCCSTSELVFWLVTICYAFAADSVVNLYTPAIFRVVHRLRTLAIDKCWSLENGIGIETPKLLFFKYSGPMNGFLIDYLNALVEADLDFGFEAEFGEYGDILYNLLRDIGCIRVLTVCSYMLQIISTAEEYPMLKPPLYKMRHLIMKTALHINEYHGISFFLFSCPRLQTLTIHISSSTTIFPEREATLSLVDHEFLSNGYIMVYKCLKRTLKVVNVTGFKGHLNEMVSQFINFSALTSLSLAWIQLSTTSFNALLSNCQLLESLSLKRCWNLENLNISTARLRTLVINKCWSLENGIGIETQKLLFFKYSGPMNGFRIDYLNALGEADLDFGFEAEFGEYGDILYDLL